MLAKTALDLAGCVERLHAERYPDGCPLMCEACTQRLAPETAPCADCGREHDVDDMTEDGEGGRVCAACGSADPRDRDAELSFDIDKDGGDL